MLSRLNLSMAFAAATREANGAAASVITFASVWTAIGAYFCVSDTACLNASRRALRKAAENPGSSSHR